MESNFKISKTEPRYQPVDIFNDMVTKSKIYRHLVDINDTISEEDIRNIKVAFPDQGTIPLTKEDTHKKNTITPWDLLDIEA